jgi:hypothetical protein
MAKKKGKYIYEVEYRVEAMISVMVHADSEEEAKAMVDKKDIEPEFGKDTGLNDQSIIYVGIRNHTTGWNKFNQGE